MNKYQIFEVIGDGTYGTVYRGLNIETNESVAIKKLKDKIVSWNECIEKNEVQILKKLNHENIVKLHEIIREQNSDVSLIFEYCGINLYEYIEKHKKQREKIPEFKIKKIIYQILKGLNYLHQNGYMHRDLKPENIFINESNLQIKIGDFGVAKEIPKYKNIPLTDYVCTRWYRAPECVLKGVNYNYSIDVWAVGCIMIELYNLNPIFPGIDEFDQLNKICNVLGTPNFNEWPEGYKLIQKLGMKFPICNKANLSNIVSDACDDGIVLINDIFQYDSNRRPSCRQLLNYAYFSDFRPSTFSYGNRYNGNNNNLRNEQKFDDPYTRNDNRNNNNNGFNIPLINNNNFSPVNKGNYSVYDKNFSRNDIAKNNRDYINNLNYRNYLNHGSVIPDLNTIFGFSQYDSNIHNNSMNDNRNNILENNNLINNNNMNGVYNQYNYNNRNKFSSQNNIYVPRKKYSNNFYNGFNDNFFNNFGDSNLNVYRNNRPSVGNIYNF